MHNAVLSKLVLVNDPAHEIPLLEAQVGLPAVLATPVVSRDLALASEGQSREPTGEEADDGGEDLGGDGGMEQ